MRDTKLVLENKSPLPNFLIGLDHLTVGIRKIQELGRMMLLPRSRPAHHQGSQPRTCQPGYGGMLGGLDLCEVGSKPQGIKQGLDVTRIPVVAEAECGGTGLRQHRDSHPPLTPIGQTRHLLRLSIAVFMDIATSWRSECPMSCTNFSWTSCFAPRRLTDKKKVAVVAFSSSQV